MDDGWSRKRSSGKEDKVDSVMWDYLDATIDHMGFGSVWRKLIYECLSAAKTAILINGSSSPEFSLQRGLRQGDRYLPSFLILQWKAYLFFFRELLMLGTSRVSRLVTVNMYPTCNLQTIL